MKSLEIKRKDGCLDLDEYFNNRLGQNFINPKELVDAGLIEFDWTNDRFWILSENKQKIALFKPQYSSVDELYIELFAEELANTIGLKTAHYDVAVFNGKRGVISYNFIKKEDKYMSGMDLIYDFYEKSLEGNEQLAPLYGVDPEEQDPIYASEQLNNLLDVWSILDVIYKNNPNKDEIIFKIMDGLVDKLIFDIIIGNLDDHAENWGILNDELAPVFDNGKILNIHSNLFFKEYFDKKSFQDIKLRFTVDNSENKNPLAVLKHFLEVSASEYKQRITEKLNILEQKVDVIPEIIETRISSKLPLYLKDYLITTVHENISLIKEELKEKSQVY